MIYIILGLIVLSLIWNIKLLKSIKKLKSEIDSYRSVKEDKLE